VRLTLIISSLQAGGAERVMATMANYWSRKNCTITLLTLDDGSSPPFYDLDPGICHVPLGLLHHSRTTIAGLRNNLMRIHAIRRAIRKSEPDIIISFMDKTNIIVLLATRRLNIPVVVSEHTNPALCQIGKKWNWLRQLTYPFADLIVVLSKASFEYFSPELQARTQVIPNPLAQPVIDAQIANNALPRPSIIAMGRLSREKGFDVLLRAFARLTDQHRKWSLTILGEGPLRSELEHLRDSLNLSHRVFLPGRIRNPHEVLACADLFAMPSRYEGFPMALCEAMACGLPVICTECAGGDTEIVSDGYDGLLIPADNVDALTLAMDRLMCDESERKRLGNRAHRVTERFAVEKVMTTWDCVLDRLVGKEHRISTNDLSA